MNLDIIRMRDSHASSYCDELGEDILRSIASSKKPKEGAKIESIL